MTDEQRLIINQAVIELSSLISIHNRLIKSRIKSDTEDEPDYLDYQTCDELQRIANTPTDKE